MSHKIEPRHAFYETEERMNISIFDKGAVPENVSVQFSPISMKYSHGDKELVFDPLSGEIDPARSDFTVGKVKVEVRLCKKLHGRWKKVVGNDVPVAGPSSSVASLDPPPPVRGKSKKNWDGLAEEAIKAEPEKSLTDDPNAGGDVALNSFFQKLFKDADDDTRRAMMKSYQESGGTALSTNWGEVGKKKMQVTPPEGSEWKKWG